MHYIQVPHTIQLIDPRTKEKVLDPEGKVVRSLSFLDYAYQFWLNDNRGIEGGSGVGAGGGGGGGGGGTGNGATSSGGNGGNGGSGWIELEYVD